MRSLLIFLKDLIMTININCCVQFNLVGITVRQNYYKYFLPLNVYILLFQK